MDADKIVRDFCEKWRTGDVEGLVEAFADDAVYHNIPMQPCRGKDEIRAFIEGFLGSAASSVSFAIRHQIVSGRIVMNERIDTLVMESRVVELPVCGVFELNEEGKIAAWRDYFDMAAFAGAAT